jgi:DUF438 domain-containing protein
VVNKILDEFKSGSKDTAEFWIELKGRVLYIRYFAVRDPNGYYKGTLLLPIGATQVWTSFKEDESVWERLGVEL